MSFGLTARKQQSQIPQADLASRTCHPSPIQLPEIKQLLLMPEPKQTLPPLQSQSPAGAKSCG